MKTWRQNLTALRIGDGAANDHDQKMHTYEVRPREDHHGVDLISNVLPFGYLFVRAFFHRHVNKMRPADT